MMDSVDAVILSLMSALLAAIVTLLVIGVVREREGGAGKGEVEGRAEGE